MRRLLALLAVGALAAALTGSTTLAATRAPGVPNGGTTTDLVIDSSTASLTVWYAYVPGSPEEKAFQSELAAVQPRFPNVTFAVVAQPFAGIYRLFEANPSHGPDLFIAPNDRLGAEARGGLLVDVTKAMATRAAGLTPAARASALVSGKYYMIPESTKTVALYTLGSRTPSAPVTTSALLEAVRGGMRLGFVADSYYAAGFFSAFGGRIVDSTNLCIADRSPGVARALDYLHGLVVAGATVYEIGDARTMYDDFIAKRLDAVIDGNWVGADYGAAFGADLRVTPLPVGPEGMSRPFVGADGWYVNARRANAALATKVALALSDRSAQAAAMTTAAHMPADKAIPVLDPIVGAYAMATAIGTTRPQDKGFGAYWVPFRTAAVGIVKQGSNATKAVHVACVAMNAANGR